MDVLKVHDEVRGSVSMVRGMYGEVKRQKCNEVNNGDMKR